MLVFCLLVFESSHNIKYLPQTSTCRCVRRLYHTKEFINVLFHLQSCKKIRRFYFIVNTNKVLEVIHFTSVYIYFHIDKYFTKKFKYLTPTKIMSVNKQIYCIKYQAKCIYVSKETNMIQKEIRLCSGHLSINLILKKKDHCIMLT